LSWASLITKKSLNLIMPSSTLSSFMPVSNALTMASIPFPLLYVSCVVLTMLMV